MKIMAIVLLCLVVASGAIARQEATEITVSVQDATLAEAIESISEASGVTILTDGKIVRSGIQFSVSEAPVDVALSAMCAPHELGWKRLYLRADPEQKLNGEDLGNLVRALAALGDMSLVALDGKTKVATSYLREENPPPDRFAEYAAEDSGYRLVYLITDLKRKPKSVEVVPDTEGAATVDNLMDQQQREMALIRSLPPEQMDAFWERQTQMFQSLDRDMKVGFLTVGMRMFLEGDPEDGGQMLMEAFTRLSPEERSKMEEMYQGFGR